MVSFGTSIQILIVLTLLINLIKVNSTAESEFCILEDNKMKVIKSKNKRELSKEVGQYVLNLYEAFEREGREKFTIALSGGSLPSILSTGILDNKDSFDFSKWYVFFADERYVSLEHKDSNYKACFDTFLKDVNIPRENIYSINYSVPLEESAKAYANQMLEVFGIEQRGKVPRFDLIMLGMGPDGHTCSLFPGHHLLKEETALVAHINDSPKPPPERITLTYPVLNNARNVYFVAAGESKADVIPKVVVKDEDLVEQGDAALPAARVRPHDGELIWFIDDAAGSKL